MDNYVITIARSYGSGGRTLGRMLAEELGIECYGDDIVRMASDRSGINEALFGETDEKVKMNPISKLAKSTFTGGDHSSPKSKDFTSKDNLFKYQADVIRELADTRSCIIIGRCADHILKDYDNVIRCYFYAPLADCIERARAVDGLPEAELIKKIHRVDKERAEYYRYFTGNLWNDASNYDLCLNTSSMSYEKLIEIVKAYIEILKK